MKKVLVLAFSVLLVAALALTVSCSKGKGGDPLVGTWAKVDDASKTVKITKEGEQYFYEGSQGKSPATKQDDTTLQVAMGPIQVTVKLDPATNVLSVAFMGENYQYKKAS